MCDATVHGGAVAGNYQPRRKLCQTVQLLLLLLAALSRLEPRPYVYHHYYS